MSPDRELLLHVFKGNTDAVEMVQSLFYISHVWDDLIDGDKVPTHQEIGVAFTLALTALNRNPFFRKYVDELLPLMEVSIVSWKVANKLQSGPTEDVITSHFLRQHLMLVVIHVARIIGGSEWAEEVYPEVIERVRPETISEYLKEIGNGLAS